MIPISIESISNTNKLIHKNLSTETTMKTILSSVLCVVLMSWSTSNIAQVTVFGSTDCGTWVNQKRITDKTWAIGYISGVNAATSTPRNDILKSIKSAEQIWLFVDKYCRDNPLQTVLTALNNLWIELTPQK